MGRTLSTRPASIRKGVELYHLLVGTAPSPSRASSRDPLALPNSHLPLLVDRFKLVVINQLSHFHYCQNGTMLVHQHLILPPYLMYFISILLTQSGVFATHYFSAWAVDVAF